jgi:SAM-dependent methyltransferase
MKHDKRRAATPDRFHLYSTAVQSVDADIAFFRRIYRKRHGRPFRLLREDFCGTALLARCFVKRSPEHRAWGVDLDAPTLAWGDEHYDRPMGRSRARLELVRADVRSIVRPKVDVVAALNFSYSVFKTRTDLAHYFRQVRRSLRAGGLFVCDAWGGTDSLCEDEDRRHIPAEKSFDGVKLPAFTYVWEQARFNPIDHHILCHIHFELRGGKKIRRAFSYDWRMWTLTELRELMIEAGFRATDVYVEGWDDEADESDGIFRRTRGFDNAGAWIAYVVGIA